ncbi:MAG: hypothetical protein PUB21_08060 [Bacteroidales bacterium]|nr:hypothetical protein [Bacteroidales bacterium]
MFQSLRQGNPFYILRKGENPRCDVGSIVSVSAPVQKFPANQAIADFSASGSNVVVSGSRDAINSEIEAMLSNSRQVVESVGYHENVIAGCEDMLKSINPSFAKERKQEEEIVQLKSEISGVKGDLSDIKGMLSQVLNERSTNSKITKN